MKPRKKIVEFYRDTDTAGVEVSSSIFAGLEFLVVNTNDLEISKPELEVLIVKNGGRKV